MLGTKIRSIETGLHHCCAVAAEGALYAWGDNSRHQLGLDPNHLEWAGIPDRRQMNASGIDIENYDFETFSESSDDEDYEESENLSENNRSVDAKTATGGKKSNLKFASVPYRVNPETNYAGSSGSQTLMPDITNTNLTPSN